MIEAKVIFDRDTVDTCFKTFSKATVCQCDIGEAYPPKGVAGMHKCPLAIQRVVGDVEWGIEMEFGVLIVIKREALSALPWVSVGRGVCGEGSEVAVSDRDGPAFDAVDSF
jgi:hypothetical protein